MDRMVVGEAEDAIAQRVLVCMCASCMLGAAAASVDACRRCAKSMPVLYKYSTAVYKGDR